VSGPDPYPKYITKQALQEALDQVSDDAVLRVNALGNLSVYMNEDAQTLYLGCINFRDGTYEEYGNVS
jgi:hypothetical protein